MDTVEMNPLYGAEGYACSAESSSPIIEAKIGFWDTLLLLGLCLVLTFLSVYNYGIYGFLGVMGLVFVIGFMRPCNIILVWLTFMYNPELMTGYPNFKATIAISIFLFVIHGKVSHIQRLKNWAVLGGFLFIVYLLLPLVIAPDKGAALGEYWLYVKAYIVMLLFIGMITTEEDMGRVLKWWAIVAALSFIPSLVHYILGPSTWLYRAYESTGLQRVDTGVVESTYDTVGRLLWAGQNGNGRGATLLFPFAIALAYLLTMKRIKKLFWAAVVSLIAVCILGTYSRGSFLSLCVIVAAFVLFQNVKAIVPLFFLVGTGLATISFIPAIRDRIFSIQESVTVDAASGRFHLWSGAISEWGNSPLVGNGLQSFVMRGGMLAHNTYLDLLTDTGLLGLGIFLVLMLMAFSWIYRSTRYREDIKPIFSKSITCGFIGICFMMLGITYPTQMLLWMIYITCYLLFDFQRKRFQDYGMETYASETPIYS